MESAYKMELSKSLPLKKERTIVTKQAVNNKNWQLHIMCTVPMFFVLLFNYVPMAGIIIAFKNYRYNKGILGSQWIGFDNFEFFFKSNDFARIVWNTLSLNFTFIVVGIISSVLLAVILFEVSSRRAVKAYQTILITPNFISWVIVSYMAYAFLNPVSGFLNMIMKESVDWYARPKAWTVILTICSVWKIAGMDSIVYYASLMGIDSSLYEAAEVDGAGKLRQLFSITIPSLIPIITILTILKIGGIFRADFGLFYQVTRDAGTLYSRTDVIDTYIYRTMRVVGDMGVSSAAGLMQSVVGFALVIVTNKIASAIDPERSLF